MIKIIFSGMIGFISVSIFAEDSRSIHADNIAIFKTPRSYISEPFINEENKAVIKIGYSSINIDSSLFGKGEVNSIEIASSYDFNRWGIWGEYEHQKIKKLGSNQFSIGGQYIFYQKHNIYMLGAIGVGIAQVDYKRKNYKVEADYTFFPINIEIGYMFMPSLGVYASLGYKWLENHHAKLYYKNIKVDDGKYNELDLHGQTYSFGVRIAF